jgi:hypothetical protein
LAANSGFEGVNSVHVGHEGAPMGALMTHLYPTWLGTWPDCGYTPRFPPIQGRCS